MTADPTKLDHNDPDRALARAARHRQRGRIGEAVAELRLAAAVLEQRGEVDRWAQVTEELLGLCPDDVPRARSLARVLLTRGEARRAARWMHWSLIAAPGEVQCVVLLADALVQLDDTDGAIDLLVQAAAADGLDDQLEEAIHARLELLTTVLQVPLAVDDEPGDIEVPERGPVPWDPTAFTCIVPLHPDVACLAPEAALGPVPTAELASPRTLYGRGLTEELTEAWASLLGDVEGDVPEVDSLLLDRRIFDLQADEAEPEEGRPRRITLLGVGTPPAEPDPDAVDPAEEERALFERELERAGALLGVGELEQAGRLLRDLSRHAPARAAVRRLLSELRCRLLARSLERPGQPVCAVS